MGEPQLVLLPDASDALSADLELSNRYLAAAAWLRGERLPHMARLFLAMSDELTAIAHRIAQVRRSPALVCSFEPPRMTFEGVVDATGELVLRAEHARATLEYATAGAARHDQDLAARLSRILLDQRRLTRAAGALAWAALQHRSDAPRLERWARRGERRFMAMLSAPGHRDRAPRAAETTPAYSHSTRSQR